MSNFSSGKENRKITKNDVLKELELLLYFGLTVISRAYDDPTNIIRNLKHENYICFNVYCKVPITTRRNDGVKTVINNIYMSLDLHFNLARPNSSNMVICLVKMKLR